MSGAVDPESVAFDLSPDKARRAIADVRGKLQWSRLTFTWLSLVCFAFALIAIAAASSILRYRPRLPTGRISLTFSESGMTIDDRSGSRGKLVWTDVTRVENVDAFVMFSFAATARFRRGIDALVIPKRALADGGESLWAFLDGRLTGTRYLQKPGAKRTLLIDTAR